MVDALEKAVTEAYPRLSHRYYKMKAKWFGKDQLNAWDRNAPLPKMDERTFDWEQAKTTVMEAYGKFSPELAKVAEPFFNSGWIDAPVKDGKSPGAFAHPTVPSAHPYLMLNYLGRARDVMTLAHELGHGVHQVLAGAAGHADGADAAHPRRNRQRLRRDADLPRACSTRPPTRSSGLRSSRPRSRTCSTRWCGRSPSTPSSGGSTPPARQGELKTEQLNEIWLEVSRESLGPAIKLNEGYDDLLGVHPALHPLAVLRLRLCLRRLSCELLVRTV